MSRYLEVHSNDRDVRLLKVAIIIALVFCVFLGRLIHLQIIRYDRLISEAADNYTNEEILVADRGTIYDRRGRVLAVNRPTFDLYLTSGKVKDPERLLVGLTEVLELDALGQLQMRDRLFTTDRQQKYRAFRIGRDLTRERVSQAEGIGAQFGGLTVKVAYQRTYPEGEIGAHLVGYLGRPNAKELADRKVRAHQMVGRFGVERYYESFLQGEDGYERFVVDAKGNKQTQGWAAHAMKRVAVQRAPTRGQDLLLSVDAQVQQMLYRSLDGYESGSVVVMDPRTGELLGMVSKPSFDPNLWSGRLPSKVKERIDANPYKPLLDKSVKSFFPGSIYKVVTALAAMEEGILDPELPIESPGAYEYGNRIFHCHKLSGHGRVDLDGAMAASADVYFYKLGERLGIDKLAVYARHFGFGERMLNFNGESAGIVPTREYHDHYTRGGFQHGLSLSSAIGQGAVQTTPLQMAIGFSTLANHGIVYRPQLLLQTQDIRGNVTQKMTPEVVRRLNADPHHVNLVRRSLERAVNDPKRATGYRAAVPMGRVAGKTGTAQVKTIVRGHKRQRVQRWQDRDHAWFAAFAPYESPRVTVVVFLEHGGSGGKDAAPVARQIIEGYHQEIEPIFDTQAQLNTSSPTRYR